MSNKRPGQAGIKHIVLNVLLVLCIAVIAVCGFKIVQSLIEYKKAGDLYDDVTNEMQEIIGSITTTVTASEPDITESTTEASGTADPENTTTESTTEPAPVPREEYRAMYEQLTSMKAQYPELFGWIYIYFDETHVISLPVMKGEDNQYYINHAYDGTESSAGAIFADYRNTDRRIDLNQNLIFYGHNMNNSTMFAMISTKYKVRDNFDRVPIVFYSMEGVYTFNVFSIYNAEAGDDYEDIAFGNGRLKTFCEEKQRKSFYSKQLTFDGDETIVTLVTCTNYISDGRVIVHGVLDGYDSFFD